MSQKRAIEAISIGQRHRRELGDIECLAASIKDIGLLHPVVVTPDGELIAGHRRLEACRRLNWNEIPVTIIPLDDILRGEWAENSVRKDFTPSEAIAIGKALEERERDHARERKRTHGGTAPGRENTSATMAGVSGEVRDIVSKAVGMGHTSYFKAKRIVESAEKDPESFGPIVDEMDATGKIAPAYKKLQKKLPSRASTSAPFPVKNNRDRTWANAAKRRLVSVIATIAGFRMGLVDFDLPRAMAAATPQDISDWTSELDRSIAALRDLREGIRKGANA